MLGVFRKCNRASIYIICYIQRKELLSYLSKILDPQKHALIEISMCCIEQNVLNKPILETALEAASNYEV